MADDPGPVKIRITLPREAAEYAVRVMTEDSRRGPVDPAGPVDLVGPNGSHGKDWPMFARFVEAAVIAVITQEWRKREQPDGPAPNDALTPNWVTHYKGLSQVFDDDIPW